MKAAPTRSPRPLFSTSILMMTMTVFLLSNPRQLFASAFELNAGEVEAIGSATIDKIQNSLLASSIKEEIPSQKAAAETVVKEPGVAVSLNHLSEQCLYFLCVETLTCVY